MENRSSLNVSVRAGTILKAFLVSAYLSFSTAPLSADGAFWPELSSSGESTETAVPVRETAQRALIYFDAGSLTETILIEARTERLSGNFVWMIPLPYLPESSPDFHPTATVEESITGETGDTLFESLSSMTAPQIVLTKHFYDISWEGTDLVFDRGWGCGRTMLLYGGAADGSELESESETREPPVTVWETGALENFDYAHLTADSGTELSGWLRTHGYGRVAAESAAEHLFDRYVNDGFSFLLITGSESASREVHSRLSISFPSERPFFPMEISTLGFHEQLKLEIYVLGDGGYKPADETTEDLLTAYHVNSGERGRLSRNAPEAESEIFYRSLEIDAYDVRTPEEVDAEGFLEQIVDEIEATRPDQLWQTALLEIPPDHAIIDVIRRSASSIPQPTNTVLLSSYTRTYRSDDTMKDIFFEVQSRETFRSRIYAHVDVAGGSQTETAGDFGFMFPVLFLVWLRFGKHR